MKIRTERALDLIGEALQGVARVELQGANEVLLSPSEGPSALLRLRHWEGEPEWVEPDVLWVLPRASSTELRRLREAGHCFVALNGAVRIRVPGLFVDRNDLKPSDRSARETRSPFSDRASLVPRALFDRQGNVWSLTELAHAAQVAHATASYVVRALEQRELVEVRDEGRERRIRLVDRRRLVEEWSREYDWKANKMVAVHAPMGSPFRFLTRFGEQASTRWAVTLQSGAALLQPHTAGAKRVQIYVETRGVSGLRRFAEQQGWPVSSQSEGDVQLLSPFYKTSIWSSLRTLEGIPVVSTLQLILDLWHYPVRGREQAEFLLEHMDEGN